MDVFSTIIPIFAVVVMGCIARRKGFMPDAFPNRTYLIWLTLVRPG